jgi:hypothetical protein
MSVFISSGLRKRVQTKRRKHESRPRRDGTDLVAATIPSRNTVVYLQFTRGRRVPSPATYIVLKCRVRIVVPRPLQTRVRRMRPVRDGSVVYEALGVPASASQIRKAPQNLRYRHTGSATRSTRRAAFCRYARARSSSSIPPQAIADIRAPAQKFAVQLDRVAGISADKLSEIRIDARQRLGSPRTLG